MARKLLYGERTSAVNLRLPGSIVAILESRARREGRTLNQCVVIALRSWLRQAGELPRERDVEAVDA